MEVALVFRRVFKGRSEACPTNRGLLEYLITPFPRKDLDDRLPLWAAIRIPKPRRRACSRVGKPLRALRDFFVCVALALFVVRCSRSDGASARGPAALTQEPLQHGRGNFSEYSGRHVEVPGFTAAAGHARNSPVSIPSYAEQHIRLQTTPTKEAQTDSPHGHPIAEDKVLTGIGRDGEAGRENAAAAERRKTVDAEPAAAHGEAVEEAETNKVVFDGKHLAAHIHRETPTEGEENDAVHMHPLAGRSSARNEDEEITTEGSQGRTTQNQNDAAAVSRETEAGANSVSLDSWLTALAIASLNPLEAAAVAAELPVVPLSTPEKMLVHRMLRDRGLDQLALYLQESSGKFDTGDDEMDEDEDMDDDDWDREIYNVAVEELQSYDPSHQRPFPPFEDLPEHQRERIQRSAAKLILLRVRDAMLEHVQQKYQGRQERLRQGLPPESHFLLELIEKIKQNPDADLTQDIRAARARRLRRTLDGKTPDGSFRARKEAFTEGQNAVVAPHWTFLGRQIEHTGDSYGTQTEKGPQVAPLESGDEGEQAEIEGPDSPPDGQTSHVMTAGEDDEQLHTEAHHTHDRENAIHPPEEPAVYEDPETPNDEEPEFEFENVEEAARALSMPEGAEQMDMPPEESQQAEKLPREVSKSLELLKAAVLAGDPIALALLRYLPTDISGSQSETSPRNDKLPGHPSAKHPVQSLVFPQSVTKQLRNPTPTASGPLHQTSPELEKYVERTRQNHVTGVAAPTLDPSDVTEQLWRRQAGAAEHQGKPPSTVNDNNLLHENENLQMQTATDASDSAHGRVRAGQLVVPNTLEPNPIVDGRTNRKRLQSTSNPSLQQFINSTPKTSLAFAASYETIPQAEANTVETSASSTETAGSPYITLQDNGNDEPPQIKHAEEGHDSAISAESEAAVSEELPQKPPKEEGEGEAEENPKEGLTDVDVEELPLNAAELEVIANLASLLPPGIGAPPMLFHVQHQHLSTPYTQEMNIQQTPPAVEDRYVFSHSPPEPAPQEYRGHQPEILVTLPFHADKDIALAASRSGVSATEDEIDNLLKATLPMWAVGSALSKHPSFSSAGEAAAAVAAGANGEAAAAPTTPIITFTGSPGIVSYSFSRAGDIDTGRRDTVTAWRFSPPTPPALQTLPARGTFTEDTEGTQQGGNLEERIREGRRNTLVNDSSVHFATTTLPYASASMPPEQHQVPPYSAPTSTLPTGGRDAQIDTSVFAQYLLSTTPWLAAGTWQQPPAYPLTLPAEAQATHHIGTRGSTHQLTTVSPDGTLAPRPYIPPIAPLTPSHELVVSDNLRVGPPVHPHTPGTYEAGEQADEHETASTGRHMRGIGPGTALTAMVDGSARQAVGAAASALPQLAHSAEQLMTTTSALVNAGNALAKSLPIEEAAQLGQYLNELRMRRKEGPPPPNFGEPSVRCMTSGMICCVPQKAVGPEWKKKPPYLNDSSPTNRVCQAHFVPIQDAVCAATEYDDKECGIERIETTSTVVFKHNLHIRGPKRLTAICECHWKQSKPGKTSDELGTPTPNKSPGESVEGFAQWKYSKKAMVEGQAARAKTEKLMSGLGAALKATALLTEQGSAGAENATSAQEADTTADQSKRLRSGVSALADALLEDKADNPSMKYVKQALADIARAAGNARDVQTRKD